MALSIVMPALEIAQETGKVLSWLKKEGEQVTKGQPLLEIETDKAVVEIEAPGDGILAGIRAQIGAVIPVGETIAWLIQPGETLPSDVTPTQSGRRSDTAKPSTGMAGPTADRGGQSPPLESRISPKARRLARENGVDISRIRGSGPGGEILASDILASKNDGTETSARDLITTEPLSSVGRLMAERTAQSWTTVPHFFLSREVDASGLLEALRKLASDSERTKGVKLTVTDVLVVLVARTLMKHPHLNASWASDRIHFNSTVNIGVAMAVPEGVVVAVIQGASESSVIEIASARRTLSERAKSGKLQPADISGATFTISNLGMYEVDRFTAIIVQPQAAILAVGRIADRVVPTQGAASIRPIVNLTLSSDHRVVDGARAARFMRDLAEAMEAPQALLT